MNAKINQMIDKLQQEWDVVYIEHSAPFYVDIGLREFPAGANIEIIHDEHDETITIQSQLIVTPLEESWIYDMEDVDAHLLTSYVDDRINEIGYLIHDRILGLFRDENAETIEEQIDLLVMHFQLDGDDARMINMKMASRLNFAITNLVTWWNTQIRHNSKPFQYLHEFVGIDNIAFDFQDPQISTGVAMADIDPAPGPFPFVAYQQRFRMLFDPMFVMYQTNRTIVRERNMLNHPPMVVLEEEHMQDMPTADNPWIPLYDVYVIEMSHVLALDLHDITKVGAIYLSADRWENVSLSMTIGLCYVQGRILPMLHWASPLEDAVPNCISNQGDIYVPMVRSKLDMMEYDLNYMHHNALNKI